MRKAALRLAFPVLLGGAVALAGIPGRAGAHMRDAPPLPGGVLGASVYAIRDPYLFTHNVGDLKLQITNVGLIGNPWIQDYSANWRGGEYLNFAGLWIGAIGGDGEAHVSTCAPTELRPLLSPIWTVYPSHEGMANGRRVGYGDPAFADDDGDGWIDEEFQDGVDNDMDGRVDEDFAAIGTQMFSCQYVDNTPEAVNENVDHVPLGLLVRQRSYQWDTPRLNEFVGIDFQIINIGDQRLQSVYLGFFSDCDVGPKTQPDFWDDDLVGWGHLDTTLVDWHGSGFCADLMAGMDAAFMWDAPDNGTTISGGDVPGVFGTLLLGHTTDATGVRAPQTVGFNSVAWFTNVGMSSDPDNDDERYQILRSGAKPAANAGKPDDYRYVFSTGPFPELNPGESLSLEIAEVVGEGQSGFWANAAGAWQVHHGLFADGDGNPATGMDGKETCIAALGPADPVLWDDPCDSVQAVVTWSSTDCLWVDQDCNPCTGVEGKETWVPWVGLPPPPPPNTNLVPARGPAVASRISPAGNGRVMLQWDNLAERLADQNVFARDRFEGYRIWKVDDWQGQPWGPDPSDWTMIGEFRKHPPSGQGGEDPASIDAVTDLTIQPTGQAGDGKPIYPVGRYAYVDNDVVNGRAYLYAVVPFALDLSGERSGSPQADVQYPVVPCGSCETTTPIRLLDFTVSRDAEGAVLRWTVADSTGHLGFHVYRQDSRGTRIELTPTLLTGGARFSYRDGEPPSGPAEYWLEGIDRWGDSSWFGPAELVASSAPPAVGIPNPNPFRDRVSLGYVLPGPRHVRATVYDLQGRRVAILADGDQTAGEHRIQWTGTTTSGRRAAAGWYVLRLEAGRYRSLRRLVLLQ